MARSERSEQEELAVEVAKARLRVAAEKAEPSRLLRQEVREAPLTSVAGALGVGVVLALLMRRRGRGAASGLADEVGTAVANPGAGLGAVAVAAAVGLARRYLPDMAGLVEKALRVGEGRD